MYVNIYTYIYIYTHTHIYTYLWGVGMYATRNMVFFDSIDMALVSRYSIYMYTHTLTRTNTRARTLIKCVRECAFV